MKSNTDLRNLLNAGKAITACLERTALDSKTLPPHSVEMHLTSACNYNCRHCSYANRNQAGSTLPRAIINSLIDDLIDESLRPKGVYYSGGGEPTTLKGWDSDLIRFSDANVETALVTNGALIKDAHLPTLSRLNYMAVSIYSTQEAAYNDISGGNNFSTQWELPGRVRAQGTDVVVGARCVINSYNHAHIPDVFDQAMEAGYDYVIFIPEIDYEARGIALSSEEIKSLRTACADRIFNPADTNLSGLLTSDFSYYRPYDDIHGQCNCASITYRLNAFINYDGGVWLCQPRIGETHHCIGNLHDAPFHELWNGPQHQEVINRLSESWGKGECENCRSISATRAWHNFQCDPANTPVTIVRDPFL